MPIFKVIVTDNADSDLAKAIGYLWDRNAQKFSEELFPKYENIKLMPKLYQRIYYEKKHIQIIEELYIENILLFTKFIKIKWQF